MTSADFAAAAGSGPLLGVAADTPWDDSLRDTMHQAGRAVMEERLLDALLTDLGS
jgi:Protein of unknown function C-terminus (DUF2399)